MDASPVFQLIYLKRLWLKCIYMRKYTMNLYVMMCLMTSLKQMVLGVMGLSSGSVKVLISRFWLFWIMELSN